MIRRGCKKIAQWGGITLSSLSQALSPGTPIISHVPALEPIVAPGMGAPGMGDITPIVGQQTIPQQQSPSLQLVGLGTNQGPPPQLAGLGTSQGPPPQLAGLGTSQGPPSQLAGLGTSQGPPPQLAGLGTSQGPSPQLRPSQGASVQLVPPQGMLPSQTVGAAATVPGPSATKLLGGPTFAPLMSGSALLMPGSTPLVTPTMTSSNQATGLANGSAVLQPMSLQQAMPQQVTARSFSPVSGR